MQLDEPIAIDTGLIGAGRGHEGFLRDKIGAKNKIQKNRGKNGAREAEKTKWDQVSRMKNDLEGQILFLLSI